MLSLGQRHAMANADPWIETTSPACNSWRALSRLLAPAPPCTTRSRCTSARWQAVILRRRKTRGGQHVDRWQARSVGAEARNDQPRPSRAAQLTLVLQYQGRGGKLAFRLITASGRQSCEQSGMLAARLLGGEAEVAACLRGTRRRREPGVRRTPGLGAPEA